MLGIAFVWLLWLGAGCTFVGLYGIPREDEAIEHVLRARVRERSGSLQFLLECPPRLNLFWCDPLVRSVRTALETAGLQPAGAGARTLHMRAPGETFSEFIEREPEPGIVYLLIRWEEKSSDFVGLALLSALTAGLIPARVAGMSIEVRGVISNPCGKRFDAEAHHELRAWVSGPFLPSAWLGGRGARGGFDIYGGAGGMGSNESISEAYADAARRVALDLVDQLDATECGGS